MLKNTAIHGPLKKGVKILLFGYATVVARIVGVDGPYSSLRQAIEQVGPPPPPLPPPLLISLARAVAHVAFARSFSFAGVLSVTDDFAISPP